MRTAQPALHPEAVAHVEAEQRYVCRTRREFERLHRVEACIELSGPHLEREE